MCLKRFATYFTWVDNVYSHRSTQAYKRKPLITHYYDCRMKGRPPGTRKSDDPNKRKRKRTARELDLCDVKIKITEYPAGFGSIGSIGSIGSGSAAAADELLQEGAGGDGDGATTMDSSSSDTLSEALAQVPRDQRVFLIQRTNGSGVSGGGSGGGGALARHKHSLAKSDEIKKNSVQRWLAARQKEAQRSQKPSPWRPTGDAAATAKKHAKEGDIKFYSACFWYG